MSLRFRPGVPEDARAIAALIESFQGELTVDPSGAGAEIYLESVSAEAERRYLASERYRFLIAELDSKLAGCIALRDGSHLFHLFVARELQGRGIARRLFEEVLREAARSGGLGPLTVNSSLRAVPVYEAFGFVPCGSVQHVHGIAYLPMRRAPDSEPETRTRRG